MALLPLAREKIRPLAPTDHKVFIVASYWNSRKRILTESPPFIVRRVGLKFEETAKLEDQPRSGDRLSSQKLRKILTEQPKTPIRRVECFSSNDSYSCQKNAAISALSPTSCSEAPTNFNGAAENAEISNERRTAKITLRSRKTQPVVRLELATYWLPA